MRLLHESFLKPFNRLSISTLLSHFLITHPRLASSLASTPLLDALLTSLQVDTSETVFQLELTIIIVLLSGGPMALLEKLPEIFAVMARAIVWRPRKRFDIEITFGGEGSDAGGDSGISVGSLGSLGRSSVVESHDGSEFRPSTLQWDRLGASLLLSTLHPGWNAHPPDLP